MVQVVRRGYGLESGVPEADVEDALYIVKLLMTAFFEARAVYFP